MNPVSSKDGLLAIYIYLMGSHHRGIKKKQKPLKTSYYLNLVTMLWEPRKGGIFIRIQIVMTFCFLFFNFFIELQLIYSVVPISAVQQSDSVIHIQTFFFNILFHYGLSQHIEYGSLCYPVLCCLSILYITACICPSQSPSPSLPHPLFPRQPQV